MQDDTLLLQALNFYRLMFVRLLGLVPGIRMPSLSKCPVEFACMPEHFVEDAMDLLIFTSAQSVDLHGFVLDEIFKFIALFMTNSTYINNPHLRTKMVEVLICWMKNKSEIFKTAVFEGHQLSTDFIRNLLKVYDDVEYTMFERDDKFKTRNHIYQLFVYIRDIPSYQNAWRKIAKEDEKDLYLYFVNHLINDSVFLLDTSLNRILFLKESVTNVANSVEWQQSPDLEDIVRDDLLLAHDNFWLLGFISEEFHGSLLLPEMVDSVANILNYFLSKLVGPKWKSLTMKDLGMSEFKPKQFLKLIVEIYINLARGDKENIFLAAISNDAISCHEEMFTVAADILLVDGYDSEDIEEFIELNSKAKVFASGAKVAEAALGEIPDEFLDPIQCTLMKDPVMLPSTKISIDRAVIERHLLNNETDPFNRSNLTRDMLVEDTDLKTRIQEFIRTHGKMKHGQGKLQILLKKLSLNYLKSFFQS